MRAYAETSFDAVGMLLCIRINVQHQLIMQKRCLPCLDTFFNAVNLQLWPRFQAILDLHINSVKKAVATGASNFFQGNVDIHPHYVCSLGWGGVRWRKGCLDRVCGGVLEI